MHRKKLDGVVSKVALKSPTKRSDVRSSRRVCDSRVFHKKNVTRILDLYNVIVLK